MPQISKRLSVEGPNPDGYYRIELRECGEHNFDEEWHSITRAEADALIAALQPPALVAPEEKGKP